MMYHVAKITIGLVLAVVATAFVGLKGGVLVVATLALAWYYPKRKA